MLESPENMAVTAFLIVCCVCLVAIYWHRWDVESAEKKLEPKARKKCKGETK